MSPKATVEVHPLRMDTEVQHGSGNRHQLPHVEWTNESPARHEIRLVSKIHGPDHHLGLTHRNVLKRVVI